MPTILTGARDLSTILADTIPVAMGKRLWHLDEVRWPTMSALMQIRREPTDNVTFKHLEDEKIPDWVTVTAADGGTTSVPDITVSDYTRLLIDDILYNPRTGRRVSVDTAPTTATSCTTIGTIVTANAVGDKLLIIGVARETGADARTAISTKKVLKTFYTQWFRHTSAVTWDEADVKQYAVAKDRLYQIDQVTRRHKEEISYSFFFGVSDNDIAGTTYAQRTSGGMDEWITSNVWTVPDGHMSRPGLFDFAGELLQYNKDASQLMMACSFRTINIISGWGLDVLQTSLEDNGKVFGIQFPGIQLGGKKLMFVHEPVMDEEPNLQGTAYIYDIGKCLYRPFVGNENRDTKLYPNIKTDNNPHIYTDEIATHCGFEFFLEPAFGKITGIEY